MSDHQIRIDITADDDASKVLDDVAEDAEKLEKLAPQVAVTADTTEAAGDIAALAGDVETLDELSPTVDVGADTSTAAGDIAALTGDVETLDKLSPTVDVVADTGTARGDIQTVADDLDTLSKQDTEILLKARIDDAKAALKDLRDDLEKTERKADDLGDEFQRAGGRIPKGQAIGDLTGPLGDVSSKASEISGVFDGLNDLTEGFAGKLGLSQGAADKLAGAVGGVGLGITAAITIWGVFKQRQEEAARKQQELIDKTKEFQDLLEDRKFEEAGQKLVDMYGDAFDAAETFGLGVQDTTKFITGQATEIPALQAQLRTLEDQYNKGEISAREYKLETYRLGAEVNKARDKYIDANGSLKDQRNRLDDVSGALRDTADDTDRVTSAQERMEKQADATKDALNRMQGALNFERAMLNFAQDLEFSGGR